MRQRHTFAGVFGSDKGGIGIFGWYDEIAALTTALGRPWFFTTLKSALQTLARHDYLLIVQHSTDIPTRLVEADFRDQEMDGALQRFVTTTHAADPVYRLYQADALSDGVFRMHELSEKANALPIPRPTHVRGLEVDPTEQTGVRTTGWPEHLNEKIIVIKLGSREVLTISLYVAAGSGPPPSLVRLGKVYPAIAALVRQHIVTSKLPQRTQAVSHSGKPGDAEIVALFFEQALNCLISPREAEIFGRLLEGRSVASIADELCISAHTVKTHRRNVYRRVGNYRLLDLVQKFHESRQYLAL